MLNRSSFSRCIIVLLVSMFALAVQAQPKKYDIVTHVPPAKYSKETLNNAIVYLLTNMKDSTWSQIAIYKNTISLGSIDKDFDEDWKEMVVKQYRIKESPLKEDLLEADGWQIMSGSVRWTFDKKPVTTVLTIITGYGARVTFLLNTNAEKYIQDYEDMMATVEIQKPMPATSVGSAPQQTLPASTGANTSAVEGVWIKSGSVNPVYGDASSWGASGSTKDQYVFYNNGTYAFYSKMFSYTNNQLILIRETGRLYVNGNSLTLEPVSSVVEAWSKRNDTDQFGKLISSQPRPLESATYTFTRHYFSGIQEWNLILQIPNMTNRDGAYGQNPAFGNAYFYSPASTVNTPIILPD